MESGADLLEAFPMYTLITNRARGPLTYERLCHRSGRPAADPRNPPIHDTLSPTALFSSPSVKSCHTMPWPC